MSKDMLLHADSARHALTPLFIGTEQCEKGHRYGPHVRQHYLIHFCLSGCGTLQDKYGTHHIGAGELFVIRPGEITVYEADKKTPWEYVWIAFDGSAAAPFDSAPSVFAVPNKLHERLAQHVRCGESAPEIYLSLLFELLYALFRQSEKSAPRTQVEQICRYIRYNYMHPLQIGELATLFGFERSYLYRLFKEKTGVGVKEYITTVRMEKAQEFLKNGHSVGECAHLVGYADEFNFSRAFKARFGISPFRFARSR